MAHPRPGSWPALRSFRPVANEFAERGFQTHVVEHHGPQAKGNLVNLLAQFSGQSLEPIERRQRRGRKRAGRPHRLNAEHESGRGLPQVVVEIAREPLALVLLRDES